MEKKNLYIDFDGVILDTITPLYEEYNKLPEEKQNRDFYVSYPWEAIIDDKYIINDSINRCWLAVRRTRVCRFVYMVRVFF